MTYKFDSPRAMLEQIYSGDIYCPDEELYVFQYNDIGSIACYSVSIGDAIILQENIANSDEEYWGAFLGIGGAIFDDPAYIYYDPDKHMSNEDFCSGYYKYTWIDCNDVDKWKK